MLSLILFKLAREYGFGVPYHPFGFQAPLSQESLCKLYNSYAVSVPVSFTTACLLPRHPALAMLNNPPFHNNRESITIKLLWSYRRP